MEHRVTDLEATVGEIDIVVRGDPLNRKDQGMEGDVGELMSFLGGFKKLMWIAAGSSVALLFSFWVALIYLVVRLG